MVKKAATFATYLEDCPKEAQARLRAMRAAIRKAAPDADEAISYGVPTFKLNGNLVHFGGYKKHIGFYPGAEAIKVFAKELAPYKTARGSAQFPHDEPLPIALVTKIVKFRVKQNAQE